MKRVLLALAFVLFLAFSTTAQTTNGLSDAEIQGQQLAQQILEQRPVDNLTNTGILQIRSGKGESSEIPIRFEIIVKGFDSLNWVNIDETTATNLQVKLAIVHGPDASPNGYFFRKESGEKLKIDDVMAPFAGSDFWICDLGLEFFHWPGQKILKHETRRTRACAVLESTNPNPAPGSYSRVDSWIDNETLGIVHAEAYDASGKLLKEFDPKSFKKVNGQWELQNMEIRNVQTGSRTWIKFDLDDQP